MDDATRRLAGIDGNAQRLVRGPERQRQPGIGVIRSLPVHRHIDIDRGAFGQNRQIEPAGQAKVDGAARGDAGGERDGTDLEARHGHVDRKREPLRRLRRRFGVRHARHVHPPDIEPLHDDGTTKQGRRAPAERDAVDGKPRAVAIADADIPQTQVIQRPLDGGDGHRRAGHPRDGLHHADKNGAPRGGEHKERGKGGDNDDDGKHRQRRAAHEPPGNRSLPSALRLRPLGPRRPLVHPRCLPVS